MKLPSSNTRVLPTNNVAAPRINHVVEKINNLKSDWEISLSFLDNFFVKINTNISNKIKISKNNEWG